MFAASTIGVLTTAVQCSHIISFEVFNLFIWLKSYEPSKCNLLNKFKGFFTLSISTAHKFEPLNLGKSYISQKKVVSSGK